MIGADPGATERERALLHETAALLSFDLPLGRLLERLCALIARYVDVSVIYFALVRRGARERDRVAYAYRCGLGRTQDASISQRADSRRAIAGDSSICARSQKTVHRVRP